MASTLFSSSPPPPPPPAPTSASPARGEVTVAELGGEFLYASPDSADYALSTAGIEKWWSADIVISSDPPNTSSLDQVQSHFVPVKEDQLKKAFNIWRNHGLIKALESLTNVEGENKHRVGRATNALVSTVLWSLIRSRSIYNRIMSSSSGVEITSDELLTQYTSLPHRSQCPVKLIALHLRADIIAVCRQDDAVLVLDLMSSKNRFLLLKDAAQSSVSCMKWSNHSDNLLGLGVLEGVVLWHIDPLQFTSRLVFTLFNCPKIEVPITTLSWSPQGQFLAVGSPGHSPLFIWDISLRTYTPIKRVQGGGVVFVSWSPSGEKVFVSHCSPVFRVWDVQNWSCERWTHLSGMCKAACWSPSGDCLLIALDGDPSLYQLCVSSTGTSTYNAVKCADLSPSTISSSPNNSIGGCVQSMVWDSRGERLAVIFTADSPSANKVGIFRTRCSPVMEVIPGGFVQGIEGEIPVGVDFHHDYQSGALLATAWSSGRISLTPFVFSATLPSVVHPPSSHTLYSLH